VAHPVHVVIMRCCMLDCTCKLFPVHGNICRGSEAKGARDQKQNKIRSHLRSSHSGPSLAAQLKPCLMDPLTVFRSFLSTWRQHRG
jgi:hypothetical protein